MRIIVAALISMPLWSMIIETETYWAMPLMVLIQIMASGDWSID